MADPPGRRARSSPPRSDSGASTPVSTGSQHPSRPSSRLGGLQPSSRTQSVTRETYRTTVPALRTLPTSESSEQGAGGEIRGRQPHSTSHPASVSGRSTPRNPAAFAQLAIQQQEAGHAPPPPPPVRPFQDTDHSMASQTPPGSRYSSLAPEDGPPPTQEEWYPTITNVAPTLDAVSQFFRTMPPPTDAALHGEVENLADSLRLLIETITQTRWGPYLSPGEFPEDPDHTIRRGVPLPPPGRPVNPDTHPPSPSWAGRDYVFHPPYDPALDSALSGGRGFQQLRIEPQQRAPQQGQASRGPPKPSKPSALTRGKKPSAPAAPGPDSAVQDVEMGEASQKLPNPTPSGQKPPAVRPGAHVAPRPQPKAPAVPFQRSIPAGLPSNPRDARFTKRKPTSFAAAAKTAPSSKVAGLVELARAAPHVSADDILRMHAIAQGTPSSASVKKKKKNPSHTTAGPSRKQVLVEFKPDRNPGNSVPYDTVREGVNRCLRQYDPQTRTQMLAGAVAYGGWSLTLTEVPSQVEVDHIRGYLHRKLPDAVAWVGLPSSKSFLRLPNVPFILDAKSNLRIKPEDIARAFEASPLRSDLVLAGPPRVVRNSKSSTRCDVFFDIWDSQQGLRAQRLIKKELLIYGQKRAGSGGTQPKPAKAVSGARSVGVLTPRTSIVISAAAARATPKLTLQSSPPRRVRSAPIRGSAWHAAGMATESSTASVPSGTIALTALGPWPSIPSSTDSKIRVLSFNIAKNYAYLDIILDRLKDEFNILFIQEPPWQTVRQAPSTVSKEGADVIGAPRHPNWLCMARLPEPGSRPRVLTYVSNRLAHWRPAYRRDLLDDRDIMIMSLFGRDRVLHFMNVYSDDQHRAIKLLAEKADTLPALSYMGGDFNCHSREWDPRVLHHRTTAILLLETAARLGLELTKFTNPGPTYVSRADPNVHSVIDLVFVPCSKVLASQPSRLGDPELIPSGSPDPITRGPSDHYPVACSIVHRQSPPAARRRTIKPDSDEEAEFVSELAGVIGGLKQHPVTTADEVEDFAQAIAGACNEAWLRHSKEFKVKPHSKAWWDAGCDAALAAYRADQTLAGYKALRTATKAAKRMFFDARIKEVAETNKRPWDLMAWVKERKNPPCEAIQFNGQPCHELSDLWDALHNTYNAASDRAVDVSILNELPQEPHAPHQGRTMLRGGT
ncbi:hypothetical protein D9611_013769 [Ephemerocybe angulata]|uniref:Endonuclease/exonuclease/phosphatase domain-containing protein n=1 Tax=Ephemerocybe angulata TaxID=980116 RepID=A0A8H5F1Q7_9AGAR|nr:hypothetical protein D9611_013769 [Tulosesus angulatus]